MTQMEMLDQLLAQSESLLVVSLLVSLACALVCGIIAARRNARWGYWSVMGFVFGPFALPFVFLAKPKSPPPDQP
jgi:ABC-type dipeptide/oligopeptide/nickel transport system permease component